MAAGEWNWRDEGDWVVFDLRHPAVTGSLCRAVVLGEESSHRLGTLLPEADGLSLRRRMKRSALEAAGCYPPQSVEFFLVPASMSAMPPYGYEREVSPAALFADPLLASHAQLLPAAFTKPLAEGGFLLAVPYDGTGEFPLIPILCFAHYQQLDGMPVVQYAFDKDGFPKLLNRF